MEGLAPTFSIMLNIYREGLLATFSTQCVCSRDGPESCGQIISLKKKKSGIDLFETHPQPLNHGHFQNHQIKLLGIEIAVSEMPPGWGGYVNKGIMP